MISVSLSDQEAEQFKSFREYQDIILALREANIPQVFKEKGGKAIFNFSKGGTLVSITLNDFNIYQRIKKLDKAL